MRLFVIVLFAFVTSLPGADGLRIWKDQQGREMEAAVVSVEGDTVVFQKEDGRKFSFPILKLSLASQSELRQLGLNQKVARIPPLYRGRMDPKTKAEAVAGHDGGEQIVQEIEAALDWLTKHQGGNGLFGEEVPYGATALALLAFLGSGELPDSTAYGTSILSAVRALLDRAERGMPICEWNSNLGNFKSFEHALATQALSEYHVLTKGTEWEEKKMESLLRKSVRTITGGVGRGGGWTFDYSDDGTESVFFSVLQVHALWLAKQTGIEFPGVDQALKKSREFFEESQNEDGHYIAGAPMTLSGIPLNGGAVFALRLMGAEEDNVYLRGMRQLEKRPSTGGRLIGDYYNCLAFFHHPGFDWMRYQEGMQSSLLEERHELGHWEANLERNGTDDRAIGTALAALILETPFRYARIESAP